MAEEEKQVTEESATRAPGTDPEVKEQPDLGASVGPGEDYDMQPEADTLSDEEKQAQLDAARAEYPDPTKGMKPDEAANYWRTRANHFEADYKAERTKRQQYAKQYGGLNAVPRQERQPDNYRTRSLDDVQDLKGFTNYVLNEAEKAFEHKMTEQRLDERVENTEGKARQMHNGEDGLPQYDELIDEYVVPMIKKNPKIFDLLRVMPDPAEASYTLGFLLKYPNFSEMLKGQTRDELVKNINGTAKQAATVKGKSNGRQPSGKLTKAEIDAMDPEEFERELERFRAGA